MNMTAFIVIKNTQVDNEGFANDQEIIMASVHVYKEGRHGSTRWANLAAFSEATDLFRMRKIPYLNIRPGMVILCDGDTFEILSVENIKGRGLYLEILAKKVNSIHG